MAISSIYIIGSLRNPEIPHIAKALREIGIEAFAQWWGAGPEADDWWKEYNKILGIPYDEALRDWAATNVFAFDKKHLDRTDAALLVLPAGKSGHLELGYSVGKGKPSFILYDDTPKRKEGWEWVAGLYEGEGSITVNNTKTKKNLQLSISSTDEDVIKKLFTTTGVGHIQGPYFRKNANLMKQPKIIKPMYRWAVYKKDDVLHVLKGIFPDLQSRRQAQIKILMEKMDWSFESVEGPFEARWDVMNNFADQVFMTKEKMIEYFSQRSEI